MSETKTSVRDEPWFKNVPEYMGEAIVLITETRDEARMMLARLQDRKEVLDDRETALMSAIKDMKEFANLLYGPDSELTKINAKLDTIERAGAARDDTHSRQLEQISGEHAQLEDWCKEQFRQLSGRVATTERDVGELQRKIA